MPASVIRATPQAASGGWVETHPDHAAALADLGLTTAEAVLDLAGEVVSGHPDRHVVRVGLPGFAGALYLKRQHRVELRERFRQWLAGFGWVSRCGREARLLRELDAAGLPGPGWVAHGEDARGRAFLMVEEAAGSVELPRLAGDERLAPILGATIADVHAAGFTTPDLTAKHVLANPDTLAVTLIDWQSARRVWRVGLRDRVAALAALHASLPGRCDRLRFLWAYLRRARRSGFVVHLSPFARLIATEAARIGGRRSIRDQRQAAVNSPDLRLVWLAGEAVCAVPDVAAVWAAPAITEPFYSQDTPHGAEQLRIELADGRPAVLVRGRCVAPLGRLAAWLRGKPWRSPGVTVGRVLFHLQRYGIPAPRLYAFGQRLTGPVTADWFALFEPPAGTPAADWLRQRGVTLTANAALRAVVRQLHEAGCRPISLAAFRLEDAPTGPRATVGDPTAVRICRRIADRDRRADLDSLERGW